MTRSDIFKTYTRIQKRILNLQDELSRLREECPHPFKEKIGEINSRCADCGHVE